MTASPQSPSDDSEESTRDKNVATENNVNPSSPPTVILDGAREHQDEEDLSTRNISDNPINFAIDSVEDEFKPSKFSRLAQHILDETKRHFNIDPLGEDYILIVATSADKGQSFKVTADSTETQEYVGQDIWAKRMVEKEARSIKLNQDELIKQAKEILKQEQAEQR